MDASRKNRFGYRLALAAGALALATACSADVAPPSQDVGDAVDPAVEAPSAPANPCGFTDRAAKQKGLPPCP